KELARDGGRDPGEESVPLPPPVGQRNHPALWAAFVLSGDGGFAGGLGEDTPEPSPGEGASDGGPPQGSPPAGGAGRGPVGRLTAGVLALGAGGLVLLGVLLRARRRAATRRRGGVVAPEASGGASRTAGNP